MQWSSRTEQQLADMVNASHVQYRRNNYRSAHADRMRQVPRGYIQQPYRTPTYYSHSEYEGPLRPRDLLLYGSWIALIIGFLGGAILAVA